MSFTLSPFRSAIASSSKQAAGLVKKRNIHGGAFAAGQALSGGGTFDAAVNPVHSTLVPYVIEQTVSRADMQKEYD